MEEFKYRLDILHSFQIIWHLKKGTDPFAKILSKQKIVNELVQLDYSLKWVKWIVHFSEKINALLDNSFN